MCHYHDAQAASRQAPAVLPAPPAPDSNAPPDMGSRISSTDQCAESKGSKAALGVKGNHKMASSWLGWSNQTHPAAAMLTAPSSKPAA